MLDCIRKLEDETRFLHLSIRGLTHLRTLPKVLEALQGLSNEMEEERSPGPCSRPVEGARAAAAWVERELRGDFPLLHIHSVVGVWSALEAMCEDLAVAWLENRPDAWKLDEVSKLKVPLGVFDALTPAEKSRFVVQELARAQNGAFKSGVGRFEALLSLFSLSPRVGRELRRALHELSQVRNVLVHCGGRADKKLLSECPWVPWGIGEQVLVTHQLYAWYHGAAFRYAERVLNQVLIAYEGTGCTCPGMDDWRARPEGVAPSLLAGTD